MIVSQQLKNHEEQELPDRLPDGLEVSVVIPTYNRPVALYECIQALCQQTISPDRFEIVVVDDGSQAPVELTSNEQEAAPLTPPRPRIRVLRQENAGPAAARNRGAVMASGTYIAFTDDDCLPQPNWLENLLVGAASNPDSLLGGTTFNGLNNDLLAEANQLILDLVYDHFNGNHDEARFLTSNNWLVPRNRFLEIGGFDEEFRRAGGEDRDFCDRWRFDNRRIVWIDEARVEHRHEQNLWKFIQLYYCYGIGAKVYHRKRRLRKSGSIGDDLSFHKGVFRRLPSYLGRYPGMYVKARLIGALGVWQLANMSGFITETIFRKARNK
jgi:glycosyltransferase involved in cell wall biosynthesis